MATNTKNFNFKKPDESDFYSIQDQNGNWDLADEELQKLNEPAFEDYTTGTSVPPAATALEALKSKIKLPVWMSNVVAFCKGCCTLAMIVNNCVSSDADKPLAAAQGKALQDQLTKLYSDFQYKELTNEFDLNKALGKYRTDSSVIITSLKNKPSEIRNAGETTLDWYPANERNTYGIQIMRWTFGNTHMIFTRNKTENTWAKWVQCATKSDLDKGQFVVKVEENIQKVITSQSDIVRGTLPSQMKDCAYAAIGFSTTIDNELSIVVDGNSIIVSPKKTNNAVTINWFQFN